MQLGDVTADTTCYINTFILSFYSTITVKIQVFKVSKVSSFQVFKFPVSRVTDGFQTLLKFQVLHFKSSSLAMQQKKKGTSQKKEFL